MIRSKFLILSLLVGLISARCFSQKVIVHAFMETKKAPPAGDTIYYDFNRNLTWCDFKGTPDENSVAGAVTASGFAFDSQMNFDGTNVYLNIGVYTFFTKHDSWKKPQINSAYHLLHEQHHFDITRIGSEKFIAGISKAHFTEANYQELLTSLFDQAYKENENMQSQYDDETKHSLDVNKQLEWNNKIAAQVLLLKEGVAIKN